MYSPEALARFWARVNFNCAFGCWLWTGSVDRNGYGKMVVGGSLIGTHRFAYQIANGPVASTVHVLHACDTNYAPGDAAYRRCVNPAHLAGGSQLENMQHRDESGRAGVDKRRGEHHGRAKLTDAQVVEIRSLYGGRYGKTGMSGPALAKMFGVAHPQIYRIIHGRTWDHVS